VKYLGPSHDLDIHQSHPTYTCNEKPLYRVQTHKQSRDVLSTITSMWTTQTQSEGVGGLDVRPFGQKTNLMSQHHQGFGIVT
jgi:hypothetical protein